MQDRRNFKKFYENETVDREEALAKTWKLFRLRAGEKEIERQW